MLLVDDPRLQDGMAQRWPPAAVADHVAAAAEHFRPARLVTFDAAGVSGHPNHRDTHAGVLHWWVAQRSGSGSGTGGSSGSGSSSRRGGSGDSQPLLPELWQLETVCLCRKYLGPADAALAWAAGAVPRRQPAELHVWARPAVAWRAPLAHTSQMVWYRRLWLLASRYMYVASLRRAG